MEAPKEETIEDAKAMSPQKRDEPIETLNVNAPQKCQSLLDHFIPVVDRYIFVYSNAY